MFSRGVISHKCLPVLPVAKYRFKNTHRIKQTHLFFKKVGLLLLPIAAVLPTVLMKNSDEKGFGAIDRTSAAPILIFRQFGTQKRKQAGISSDKLINK